MTSFIAFFDILGFKKIVLNNSPESLERIFERLQWHSGLAACDKNIVPGQPGTSVPNQAMQKVHCLHISDSIIFWTNSDSDNDFQELVQVCSDFYRKSLQVSIPLRGCISHGKFSFNPFQVQNKNNISFYNFSLLGKALVDAYTQADNMEYAGCILSKSAIQQVENLMIERMTAEHIIIRYTVPIKGEKFVDEFVLTPFAEKVSSETITNKEPQIQRLFTQYTKEKIEDLSASVRMIMENTLQFIGHFQKDDECGLK